MVYTNGQNKDFNVLCGMLDEYLDEAAGGKEKRAYYIPFNKTDDIHDVFVEYENEQPVGCASFKRFDGDTAEVKRVFVREEYRGKGIAKRLMSEVEKKAKEKGFKKLVLETGAIMADANGLYKSIGYKIIDNYGQYKGMSGSVCMEKTL